MSDESRAQLWAMWAGGKSVSKISRAISYPPGSIFTVIKRTGGYIPAPRTRRSDALTLAEREEISGSLTRKESVRQIARTLERAASTVSREIAGNRGRGRYPAVDADDRAWRRARRPKACLLARNPVLRAYVAARLGKDWSPEQIAGVLATDAPIGTGVRVSHETIYKSLFVQWRAVLAKELEKNLRTGRPTRRNIPNTVTGQWRSQVKDAVSIGERPAEVEDWAVPGHWEGDLLLGRHWTQVATVVERATRFTVRVALDGRDMTTVSAGLPRGMTRLPEQVRKSVTWDRGMELADHRTVTVTIGLEVYFADPRSLWRRGTNENTNRLLRQYLPKGQSMTHLAQDDLDVIAAMLNTRPRKTLGFAPRRKARCPVALTA
jgi:IS30 family transposase